MDQRTATAFTTALQPHKNSQPHLHIYALFTTAIIATAFGTGN